MSPARLAVALALACAALPAPAQEKKPAPAAAAPAAKPAPAKPDAKAAGPAKPAATELARLLMPKKTWSDGLDQLGQMVQMRMQMHVTSSSLEYPKDMPAKIRSELEGVLPYEELIGIHARELSAGFSDGELGDLLAFYRSPTGQKSLVKMGEVQNKVSLETQKRIEGKMPDIMKKLSAFAKASPAKEGGAKKDAPAGQKPAGHP